MRAVAGGDEGPSPSSLRKRESRRKQKAALSKLQKKAVTQARLRVRTVISLGFCNKCSALGSSLKPVLASVMIALDWYLYSPANSQLYAPQ